MRHDEEWDISNNFIFENQTSIIDNKVEDICNIANARILNKTSHWPANN